MSATTTDLSEVTEPQTAPETVDQPSAEGAQTPEQMADQIEQAASNERRSSAAKRISELTRKWREAERRAELAERGINNAGQGTEIGANDEFVPRSDVERLAFQRARELASQETLNQAANRTAAEGKKLFPDFDDAVRELADLGVSQRREFLEAITDLPNGAAVFHHLGKNPDLALDVADLTPHRMAIRLAKLSQEIAASPAKPISAAPDPVRPLAGASTPRPKSLNEAKSMDEWVRLREAQIKAEAGDA
jgi:hypothetical protein